MCIQNSNDTVSTSVDYLILSTDAQIWQTK